MRRSGSTLSLMVIGASLAAGSLLPGPAQAEQVTNERDIVGLRLGQRIQVDDGTCPAGQIKEVTGARLSSTGVIRSVTCVLRGGNRR